MYLWHVVLMCTHGDRTSNKCQAFVVLLAKGSGSLEFVPFQVSISCALANSTTLRS